MPHHETIALLSHPNRYDVTSDPFLTTDLALAAELAAAGAAVLRPDSVAPVESLAEALTDASAGWLKGYRRGSDGTLEPVEVYIDAEASDD